MNYVICSHKITEKIEANLINHGAVPVKLRGFGQFGESHPLCYHPDMFCFKSKKNKWVFYEGITHGLNIDAVTVKSPVSCVYPRDIGLNAAVVGDYLICNVKYTDETVLEHADKIIDVKQGYAKCSVCMVDENSIITSDAGIYSAAKKNNIEVLLISKGHITLDGYNYGFIGGCSGLISKNKLAFTGSIAVHPDYEKIKKFCEGRGVEIVSLSNEKLYDYGSMFIV